MRLLILPIALGFCSAITAYTQTSPQSVQSELSQPIQPTSVTAFQVQEFLLKQAVAPPHPASAADWSAREPEIRKKILNDIAFHGWPSEWINADPSFTEAGRVETDGTYQLHKFRYQIVPGFWSTALLYEPAKIQGRIPAILDLDGHFKMGKADEWEQKLCINLAKRGVLVLDLEWFGYGEMSNPEDAHDFGAHIDLTGSNVLGLFYLAMKRGLDYLVARPDVDPLRVGVTGISGGGWQTILLSSLDTRVKVAVEVAGFEALVSGAINPRSMREVEIDAPDLCQSDDYTDFVALRAPRPTLLIHNAKDLAYRSEIVKPYIYDDIKPVFQLYGAQDALAWHENLYPGNHNYQIDNRQHAYAFFDRYLGLQGPDTEIPVDAEIKTYDELKVGVPEHNLTVLGIARELAAKIQREPIPQEPDARETWANAQRAKLKQVIRYQPTPVEHARRMNYDKDSAASTLAYRLDFGNGLSATGVWMKAADVPVTCPATIVLNDQGISAAADVVSDRVNRGEQVLALDLIFNGSMRAENPERTDYQPLVDSTGARVLGLQVAQLVGAAQWMKRESGCKQIRVDSTGIRSQVVTLSAASLDPSLFSDVTVHGGMRTLAYLIDAAVPFRSAPELFCLDLYKYFDIDRLVAMASGTVIKQDEWAALPSASH